MMPLLASPIDPSEFRLTALSRWDNEGGALSSDEDAKHDHVPDLTDAELVHLRVRVIALENLMIAELAVGSDKKSQIARDIADYISPKTGFTPHPLTIKAADHIIDLVDRAIRFRTMQS